jgi:histidine triad (HIT) family protein
MDKSLFEKIADREIPSFIVWEDDNYLAFLDIYPLVVGQTLVVPRRNISDYVFSIDDPEYERYMKATKQVARIMQDKLRPIRVMVSVEGFEVPHAHIKLIPAFEEKPITSLVRQEPSKEQLEEIYNKLIN